MSKTIIFFICSLIFTPAVFASPDESIADYRGSIVYLDFWASWCGPCKLSFPFMQRLQSKYADEGLKVIAVNLDRKRTLADKFLREIDGELPQIFWDPKGEWAEHYDVKDMPTSVLIDRSGQVRFIHEGFHKESIPQYITHIEQLLAEKD
jgi:thiol-disulfide isomerase/thioredoxin